MNRHLFADSSARIAVLLICSFGACVTAKCDEPIDVRHILAQAPHADSDTAEQLNIVLLADVKDHGPAGNGLHDYPLWQSRWAMLLGGRAASSAQQVNLNGAKVPAADMERGAPGVQVTTAWKWPSPEQFKSADAIVAFCYVPWTDIRLTQMRQYIERGGGLVLVHSATWTRPGPSQEVARLVGVGGFELYRHGVVPLEIATPTHPICLGLPKTITLANDETYWPPTPLMDEATVLATAVEEQGERGSTPKAAQPMFWCHTAGKGRVFGCVPGHCSETFDDPLFRILLLRGIAWSAGQSPYRLDTLVLRGSQAP